jgi:uncharacterized protein YjbI with pentapeptide repeats
LVEKESHVADEQHLAKLLEGVEKWNQWRRENSDLSFINLSSADLRDVVLSGAYFNNADLSGANLSGADLSGAYFDNADLSGANLSNVDLSRAYFSSKTNLRSVNLRETSLTEANLRGVNLSNADLRSADLNKTYMSGADLRGASLNRAQIIDAELIRSNLSNTDFSDADLMDSKLFSANLRCANLSNANLFNTDLSGADLRNANLSNVLLVSSKLLGANLTAVTMTGACIQDWSINNEAKLDGITCEWVYLQAGDGGLLRNKRLFPLSNRRPSDPNAVFAPGEFTKLFQKSLETVDLIFADGIDWKAFFQSFQELRSRFDEDDISIQAIEKKSGGAFVIRLEVSPEVDKAAIERQAKEFYSEKLRLLESNYQAQLQMQEENLEHERKRNSQLMRLVEVMAENTGPKYDLRNTNIGNLADTVKDNARQQTNQYNYEPPEKQSLAEAATEIQRLLKVLETTNPTATEADKKNFVSLAVPPTLKQRAVGALQSGGKAALAEFLDNPYVNVGVAIVEGWREAK